MDFLFTHRMAWIIEVWDGVEQRKTLNGGSLINIQDHFSIQAVLYSLVHGKGSRMAQA